MSDDDELARELRSLAGREPAPPPQLTDAVMQQVALHPRPRPSFWARLTAPRELRLRIRPLQLVAVGAAAALALFALRPRRTAPTVAITATPDARSGVVRIRFALAAPTAHAVSLAGDFNGWRPEATPLVRGSDGVWTATVPLEPGSWAYSFVVDGKFEPDPRAAAYRPDGFGGKNAIVRVSGGTG